MPNATARSSVGEATEDGVFRSTEDGDNSNEGRRDGSSSSPSPSVSYQSLEPPRIRASSSSSSSSPRSGSFIMDAVKRAFSSLEQQQQQQDGKYAPAEVSDTYSDDDNDGDDNGEILQRVRSRHGSCGADRSSSSPLVSLVIVLSVLLLASLMSLASVVQRSNNNSAAFDSKNHLLSNSIADDDEDRAAATATAAASLVVVPPPPPQQNVAGTAPFHGGGAVASDQAVCSRLAADSVLHRLGGNAVDAAVTTALCLGVANPASSGLGGGAFMLIHATAATTTTTSNTNNLQRLPDFIDARNGAAAAATATPVESMSGRVTEVIDCRERAPEAANTSMYSALAANASVFGGLAIPVPGELKCLELAHARFGRLEWKAVVEPVIALAESGLPIGHYLATQIHDTAHHFRASTSNNNNHDAEYGLRPFLTTNDDWNQPLKEGDLLRNRELADTLRAIAADGADAVYKNRAAALAAEIQAAGGIVTADDITAYRATLRSPLVARHVNGFAILGVPPPSSGGAAILGAVRFLSGFDTPLASFAETLSAHRIVEACKHVFAIRMSLSDPDFNTATVTAAVNDLVSGTYMDCLRRSYHRDNATMPLSKYGGDKWAQLSDADGDINVSDAKEGDRTRKKRKLQRPFGYLEDHGTSHFSVVDRDGNAVAMTTSVNTNFGSTVRSASTGIIFSNTMDDFSKPGLPNHYGLRPAESNYIMPGKRPLSSMSPTLVFRETENSKDERLADLVLVIGASGGPKIITSVLQVLLNFIMMGKPLLESIVHPRLHDQLVYHGASVTAAEKANLDAGPTIDVSQRTRDALIARGHRMLDIDFSGTVQAIAIDLETKQLTAASDPRKGGSPAGY